MVGLHASGSVTDKSALVVHDCIILNARRLTKLGGV